MKGVLIAMVLMISTQAMAAVNLDLGNNKLDREIAGYLARRLEVCSQGVAEEKFTVMNLEVRKHKVDQGIIDTYYTIAIGYTVNEENLGALEVKLTDWDFHNYTTLDEKIAFEISQDHTGLCK